MKTLNQKIRGMLAARQKNIEDRAAQLIAEELSLRKLRRALPKSARRTRRALRP
jgi:hypothetical protein